MKIHSLSEIHKGLFINPVVTVGIFDGVHKGHARILNDLKEKALSINGETVLITLWPHPRVVFGKQVELLTTLDEKIELLKLHHINHLIIIPFSKDFAQTTANEFVENILVEKIGARAWLLGFDNHFGHNKEGNYDTIKETAAKFNIELMHPSAVFIDDARVSSTSIRELLDKGEVLKAEKFLGYHFKLSGTVTEGKKLGRTIGFPTANLNPQEFKKIPGEGVYAVLVEYNNKLYKGMLNIGFRPTIDPEMKIKTIETHIFDFSEDIYHKNITLYFAKFLRKEIKFAGLEMLVAQLRKDAQDTQKALENYKF